MFPQFVSADLNFSIRRVVKGFFLLRCVSVNILLQQEHFYPFHAIPSNSSRYYNKQMSGVLPSFNLPFCQSIYDFIKMLIGIDYTRSSTSQLFVPVDKHILEDRSVFIEPITFPTSPVYAGKKNSISTHYRLLFMKDLERLNLHNFSFDWTSPASSTCNNIMIQLISKHWTYASTQGAFSKYPIDPAHETPFNISGVITRWFNGKRERVRKEKNPEDAERVKLLRKKSRWRSNLDEIT
ncbi:hypothetical protein PtB15_8B130 [Puccinia triticina]|nr:hypothetical protein PtB15_8B130 [Puccinia triticina]